MKNQIDIYNNFAKVYDLLREVFFNEWKKNTITSLKKKAEVLEEDFKEQDFISSLLNLKEDDIDEIRWEYNRLFIGPEQPLAIPFESPYRSDKNLLMQEYTYEVREAYSLIGLEVEKLNHFPDDYIGFEFQYLFYTSLIISQMIKDEQKEDLDKLLNLREEFIVKHPFKWFDDFCDDIIKKSNNEFFKELASFILYIMQKEKNKAN